MNSVERSSTSHLSLLSAFLVAGVWAWLAEPERIWSGAGGGQWQGGASSERSAGDHGGVPSRAAGPASPQRAAPWAPALVNGRPLELMYFEDPRELAEVAAMFIAKFGLYRGGLNGPAPVLVLREDRAIIGFRDSEGQTAGLFAYADPMMGGCYGYTGRTMGEPAGPVPLPYDPPPLPAGVPNAPWSETVLSMEGADHAGRIAVVKSEEPADRLARWYVDSLASVGWSIDIDLTRGMGAGSNADSPAGPSFAFRRGEETCVLSLQETDGGGSMATLLFPPQGL